MRLSRLVVLLFVGLVLGGPFRVTARAETTVVISEIMYRSLRNDPAQEWVELHSMMSVDLDISGWRLDGAVHFTFPQNTVLTGGTYVVVAAAPASLNPSLGGAKAFGPWTGSLENQGEAVILRDHEGRTMDRVDYDSERPWPVAANGSGASLTRRDVRSADSHFSNWAGSAQTGGTPGRTNAIDFQNGPSPIVINEASSTENPEFWIELYNPGADLFSFRSQPGRAQKFPACGGHDRGHGSAGSGEV